ncbi:hypothetical protein CCR82_13035 [Halochromatium salexigens]|uniref:DUF1353 domain-containing protein n=1 Tax=Halochromatium salexigens TaxID=49447 RepID=A0AAJ0UHI1_HALSE|nr:hypothetical protein [Halochromatium salexigens]
MTANGDYTDPLLTAQAHFASIPRLLWPLLPPVGRSGKAAVIHDWLCDEQPHSVDHRMAADIFNESIMVWAVK